MNVWQTPPIIQIKKAFGHLEQCGFRLVLTA